MLDNALGCGSTLFLLPQGAHRFGMGQQLGKRTLRGDLSVFQHNDLVGAAQRSRAVGNGEDGGQAGSRHWAVRRSAKTYCWLLTADC